MKTYDELIEIASQKKVKHYRRYKKHELEKVLEFEKTHGEKEFFEKYCKEKWKKTPVLAKNSKGEKIEFKSLYASAKYFNTWPATVKWRILEEKKMKLDNGDFWKFSYIKKQN